MTLTFHDNPHVTMARSLQGLPEHTQGSPSENCTSATSKSDRIRAWPRRTPSSHASIERLATTSEAQHDVHWHYLTSASASTSCRTEIFREVRAQTGRTLERNSTQQKRWARGRLPASMLRVHGSIAQDLLQKPRDDLRSASASQDPSQVSQTDDFIPCYSSS